MKTIKNLLIMSVLFVGCSTIISAQKTYRNRQWTKEDQKRAEEFRKSHMHKSRIEENENCKEKKTCTSLDTEIHKEENTGHTTEESDNE